MIFQQNQTYSTGVGSHPISVITNDFNNDNYLDIVIADNVYFLSIIFYGNGNGLFILKSSLLAESSSLPITLNAYDFNDDIIVSYTNATYIGLYFGYKNDSFSQSMKFLTEKKIFSLIAFRDLDKFNFLDMIVGSVFSYSIEIFYENSNEIFFIND
ncbi:unnamed protein product [Adineta ricciae]|uniref:VCBS repeat-containing protein n=1 Tax=Adineta ricciae TaxID=249248 RepID=A0A815LAT6_ADIRI|nr:unnamed protein product [Adineta ricciae]CAF1411336.1 unnamed protein product [Adineta ricciae]